MGAIFSGAALTTVIPAQAGIQGQRDGGELLLWIPACAGMTTEGLGGQGTTPVEAVIPTDWINQTAEP